MDATYRVPQYSPPGYFEGLPACSDSHYDTKPYCDHHAASHCLMHAFSNQAIYDDQHSMPNSLHEAHGYSKDHTSLQHNHPHVPAELHLNISTASDQVQHVGMSISLRLSADHDPMIVDQGNDGSMGMPQRALHSERPPISSYSELSAHMSYYNGLSLESRQSKTPSLVTVPMDSKPLNNTSLIQRPNTPPPSSSPSSSSSSSKAQRPFEAWSPRQRKDVKNGDRPVKDEEDSSLPPTRRKRQSSPRSPTRSPSSESRRSRTLSPSSQSQGVLKTIMMKKGGSEPKKQNLACLFCRERKIACGRPAEGSLDPTCNQCLRRSLTCQYPTESRRGQHKRNSKKGSNTGHGSNRAK
ncbi:hypothetical protein AX15_006968 [Amanita polypyramis BW_CC]|nr:hypothetical protein AX15_006968 [Amanita polypyramis BW_CC]